MKTPPGQAPERKTWITFSNAAEFYGIKPATFRSWIKNKMLHVANRLHLVGSTYPLNMDEFESRLKRAGERNRNSEPPTAKGNEPPALQAMSEAPEHRVQVRAAIATLAELSKLEFELQRKEAAKAVGLRVSAIDQLVNDVRSQFEAAVEAEPLWPEAVEGASLLEELVSTIRKYVILGLPESHAVALWILFTHCFSAASFSPRLAATSPEKRRENHAIEDSSSRMPACSALVQCDCGDTLQDNPNRAPDLDPG
jgi:hypothetical protein